MVSGLDQPQGIVIDVVAGMMYWTEVSNRTLSRANLDGSNREVIVGPTSRTEDAPYGVALDSRGGKIYWTTQCCTIQRANLNGMQLEHLVNATYSGGIALDVQGGKMYWTSWMEGIIWRADLDGGNQEEFLSSRGREPIGIALDTRARKVYWADVNRKSVLRANMRDGSGLEALNVSWAIKQTNGIALDLVRSQIYLTGSERDQSGSIYRARLDGSESEVLVANPSMGLPWGIALDADGNAVYWTDQRAGTIQRLYLRCRAGTMTVYNPPHTSSGQVRWDTLDHSSVALVDCPPHFSGSLRLACTDGVMSVSSGECRRECPAGNITQAVYSLPYNAFPDGRIASVDCAGGFVGAITLSCRDGVVSQVENCRRPRNCPAQRLQLPESAQVSQGELRHGDVVNGNCPHGFTGSWSVQCNDGQMDLVPGSLCAASCEAGSLWIDSSDGTGSIEVAHGTILPGRSIRVTCPEGSAGKGVNLECVRDFIRISAECYMPSWCPGGQETVNGVVVQHGPINDGRTVSTPCPAPRSGVVNFTCRDGSATMQRDARCYLRCQGGYIKDGAVTISYREAVHGEVVIGTCPDGYEGAIRLQCTDGVFSKIANSTCGANERCCHEIENETSSTTATTTEAAAAIQVASEDVLWLHRHGVYGENLPLSTVAPAMAILVLCGLGFCLVRRTKGWRRCCESVRAPELPAAEHPPTEGSEATEENEVIIESPVPLPTYWATTDGVHIFPDPNRIGEVQRLMDRTWRMAYTRDRRLLGGSSRVPASCRVANVLRIEHHPGYRKYWHRKVDVAVSRGPTLEDFPVATDGSLVGLDAESNEKYLFHGTNPEAAHAIARNLFNIDMAGSCRGSMFGPGIYLAENASKSDEYAKEGSGVYVGLCAMLVCRAVIGRVLTAESSGDLSEQVKSGEYDSVCGDRLAAAGTFREMVLFHEQAVYAEFIVIYARVFDF